MTGRIIGMHTFGASAPLKALQKKFGFEPSQVVTAAKEQLVIEEAARVLRIDTRFVTSYTASSLLDA
jgi:hypothetical protein